MKKYGEAVFGTVTESAPVAETTHGKIKGENREGIAIFRGIPYGGSCSGESAVSAVDLQKKEVWEKWE